MCGIQAPVGYELALRNGRPITKRTGNANRYWSLTPRQLSIPVTPVPSARHPDHGFNTFSSRSLNASIRSPTRWPERALGS